MRYYLIFVLMNRSFNLIDFQNPSLPRAYSLLLTTNYIIANISSSRMMR